MIAMLPGASMWWPDDRDTEYAKRLAQRRIEELEARVRSLETRVRLLERGEATGNADE